MRVPSLLVINAALLFASGCYNDADPQSLQEELDVSDTPIIHGTNSMHNIHADSSQTLREFSKSVMFLTYKNQTLFNSNNQLDFSGKPTFNTSQNICPAEMVFNNELVFVPGGIGSGSLLSQTILVTAGHNLTEPFPGQSPQSICSQLSFVFDFQKDFPTQTGAQTNVITKNEDVFSCKRIHRYSYIPSGVTSSVRDYAIIELDRPTGRAGLPYDDDPTHSPYNGESVVAIGHPMGLPKKISDGTVGAVLPSAPNQRYIFTNTDTWQGNSGGPLISRSTGLQWGIVSGDTYPSAEFSFANGNFCRSISVDNTNSQVQFNSPLFEALGTQFTPSSQMIGAVYAAPGGITRRVLTGDISGDGRDDMIVVKGPHISSNGLSPVEIALASNVAPNTFVMPQSYQVNFYGSYYSFPAGFNDYALIDMNKDGRADLVGFSPNSSNIYVAYSNGADFGLYNTYSNSICYNSQCKFGDVNGDGYTDIVAFDTSNQVRVSLSKGAVGGFNSYTIWKSGVSCVQETCNLVPYNPIPGIVNCYNYPTCDVADFDGDKKVDIVRATNGDDLVASRRVEVALSTGYSFGGLNNWGSLCSGDRYLNFGSSSGGRPNPIGFETYMTLGGNCTFKDTNGDGMADVVDRETNLWDGKGNLFVATSTGAPVPGFRTRRQWHSDFCGGSQCAFGDINGDGRADALSFFRSGSYYQLWSTWAK